MIIKRKGFTLIEIIVVVAIIAILASAVIIAINPAKNLKQARNSTRWSQMNAIANGIYSYVIDNQGVFPSCLSSSTERIVYNPEATTTNWGLVNINTCSELLPTYLPQFPEEPQGKAYVIGYATDTVTSDRIIVRCTAQEAMDENILVIQ